VGESERAVDEPESFWGCGSVVSKLKGRNEHKASVSPEKLISEPHSHHTPKMIP